MDAKKKEGEGAWSSEGMAIEGDPLFQDDLNDLSEEVLGEEWLNMQKELKGQIDGANEVTTPKD